MRRRIGWFLFVAVWLASLAVPTASLAAPPTEKRTDAPQATKSGKVKDSWIVTTRVGHNGAQQAKDLAASVGGKAGHVYTHALHGFEFKGSAKAAANLAKNPNVRTVVPN